MNKIVKYINENEVSKMVESILKQGKDIDSTIELKLIDKSFKFGVATVVNVLHKWCDRLKEMNINASSEDIRNAFNGYLEDADISNIFNRLNKEEEKKNQILKNLKS
ncbi:hypothetical protein [Paenibacillus xylaniclasticus]|uniref:hypothetical protein n=1 Tax=Paenibacillus xylaniclasticus TaxID=588083 RepID=UPI000FDBFEB9|nr:MULTISPECIES: hypothetical protein [Paenibacillus]GFN32465.1 hypothetical protein PCURB6_27250 [Paenibacillus curdlanolyticus]